MINVDHQVRSEHCPNRYQTCGSCAWGFTLLGHAEQAGGLVNLDAGYMSDCGRVALYRDESGRLGALRGGAFYPGIPGNPAYEAYVARHTGLGVLAD